jgi:hypothetical protein
LRPPKKPTKRGGQKEQKGRSQATKTNKNINEDIILEHKRIGHNGEKKLVETNKTKT